jgi:hypothetical protein
MGVDSAARQGLVSGLLQSGYGFAPAGAHSGVRRGGSPGGVRPVVRSVAIKSAMGKIELSARLAACRENSYVGLSFVPRRHFNDGPATCREDRLRVFKLRPTRSVRCEDWLQ